MLTMTRKSELLRSKWPEFDLDAAQWDIPAERMKMGKPHRVFLSRQAVEILRQVHELTGHGEYVFPSIFRGSVPMGDVTLNHFFKRIDFGVPDFSPHGTRGTAATLLREHGFGRDVVELLLAHSEKNATVAAYSHMELAADRKRALQYLADRVEALGCRRERDPVARGLTCTADLRSGYAERRGSRDVAVASAAQDMLAAPGNSARSESVEMAMGLCHRSQVRRWGRCLRPGSGVRRYG